MSTKTKTTPREAELVRLCDMLFRQRDELLAACERLLAALPADINVRDGYLSDASEQAIAAARAAIQKARGES